nr:extracellular solute-binding protein [uncultured Eisenbergiella sp.]
MKKGMNRKYAAAALAMIMLAGSLAGCGNRSKDTSVPADAATGSEAGEESTPGGETKEDPITITAFKNSVAMPADWKWGDDPVSQRITELTGVTVEMQYATTTDNTEINTLLASGEKLPDIIITAANGPVRSLLVDQGFAVPLNELADKSYPEFYEVLPKDMDKIYQEADGNFYCVASFYGDANKYGDQILNSRGPVSFSIRKDLYDELGRPDVSTLENYKNVVLQIKEKHPEINHPIWDYMINTPWNSSSLLNVLARMYGADNNYFHYNGDQVEMVFMQPYYKEALKTYNNWYRSGLINPEMFAYKTDQQHASMKEQDIISYVGYYWSLLQMTGIMDQMVYETIEFPMPEGKNSEELKIHDDYFSTGYDGVFITKDAKDPVRCLKYIAFLLSDEGQLLQRYGLEGLTWEKDEQGRPRETELKIETERESMEKLQKELGVYNYDFAWLTSTWAIVYGAHNTYQSYPGALRDFEIMTPHQQNERFSDLVYALTDTDELVLREQIFDTWKSGAAAIIVTNSDAEFEAAYDKFISDMNKSGVDQLCSYFTQNSEYWKALGLSE